MMFSIKEKNGKSHCKAGIATVSGKGRIFFVCVQFEESKKKKTKFGDVNAVII